MTKEMKEEREREQLKQLSCLPPPDTVLRNDVHDAQPPSIALFCYFCFFAVFPLVRCRGSVRWRATDRCLIILPGFRCLALC